MDTLELIRQNLLSPMVLAYALGIVAMLVRSDLRFPDALYQTLSIYLLLAIGLKGGAALAATPFADLWAPALATLLLGCLVPVLVFAAARGLRFEIANAAALAAHYGSVSVVTFIAAQAFLQGAHVEHEAFMPTLVAILEVPGIVVALTLARLAGRDGGSLGGAIREVLTGKSIVLLIGGVLIGAASGHHGMESVAPLFVDLFKGALTLFLLEMGLLTAQRLGDVRRAGVRLVGLGLVAPVVLGALGAVVGSLAGLSAGGTTVFAAMVASASYIAAPAAVRIALPQASPSVYLSASLVLTFPFNLTLGIPLYHALSTALHRR
ncbi:MAG: sodium-dependent bicarbonate transport family permease [Planctomycetes bacterium]|nr:sodium-dependent bicarbonate transport family permease [Planctomycetota bacterium]